MTITANDNSIVFSIISTLLLSIIWGVVTIFVSGLSEQLGIQMLLLTQAMVSVVFAVFAMGLLGKINKINVIKHVFNRRGFTKGLLILIPVAMFFLLGIVLNTSDLTNIGTESVRLLPVMIFMQIASAFMQNILFRGLLVTALFVKFSSTAKERVRSIFIASALYLIIYILLNVFNTGELGLMQLINTFVVGAGFCVAYLYTRNILSLMFVQGIWQALSSMIALFSADGYSQSTSMILIVLILATLISIIITAIIFSKRAKPFSLEE